MSARHFATQQAIVAEIEAEQVLVATNRELIARFKQKIQATLARVWGEAAAPRLNGTSINSGFVIPCGACPGLDPGVGIQLNQASGFRVKPGMTIDRSDLNIVRSTGRQVRQMGLLPPQLADSGSSDLTAKPRGIWPAADWRRNSA